MTRYKGLVIAGACLIALTAFMGGAAAQGSDIYTNYYTPQFYVDNLVFFDEDGTPYYYENDEAYSVPEDYPGYEDLSNYYWDHIDEYLRWFDEVGYANLSYRQPVYADYYKPRFYQNYPIFYRDDGRPYYYVDGVVVYVPRHDPLYSRFVRHYRAHRAAYNRWYHQRGRHYQWYRRPIRSSYYNPIYHNGYLVFFDAAGLPFFYRDNRQVYISRTDRRFPRYTTHYRTHRDPYRRWYRESGRSHHGYRQNKGYRQRRRNDRAPRARSGRIEDRSQIRRERTRDRSAAQKRRQERREQKKDRREEVRKDRREDKLERREERKDLREQKKDRREEIRKDRREDKLERREEKRDLREQKKDRRQEIRKDRREEKVERREQKKDLREQKKDRRQEVRKDRRENKVERRQEKRDTRKEKKAEKKAKKKKKNR